MYPLKSGSSFASQARVRFSAYVGEQKKRKNRAATTVRQMQAGTLLELLFMTERYADDILST
jgi:hypothetical protein